jgi:hypothetical protein
MGIKESYFCDRTLEEMSFHGCYFIPIHAFISGQEMTTCNNSFLNTMKFLLFYGTRLALFQTTHLSREKIPSHQTGHVTPSERTKIFPDKVSVACMVGPDGILSSDRWSATDPKRP